MSATGPSEPDIDRLFRREAARLISVLTRILGPHNLELAEDVVQDSFAAALRDWSAKGVPDNPAAWLLTTARNRAIDAIRRERTQRRFAPDLAHFLDSEWTLPRTVDEAFEDDWARDDQLRMIFMCCQPRMAAENRLPLILRTLCGLSIPAIARALLTSEATINKRLFRTRKSLEGVSFELPAREEIPAALETVHTVLYLLFNEGYLSTGEEPVRRELCLDAMHLTRLLIDAPSSANSDTMALMALMCFAQARVDSRVDAAGHLVPLDRQDRSTWDQSLIRSGYAYLAQSSRMEAVVASRYHLEAAIASRHCSARTFEQTDWESIAKLYDRLLEIDPSSLTRLNRAVAISYRSGPEAAIPLVEALAGEDDLPSGHLIPATLANLYQRAGHAERAAELLEEALARTRSPHERRLIETQASRSVGDA
jgi:RNA polymerase sigma-70 factor (ECF subfamily)